MRFITKYWRVCSWHSLASGPLSPYHVGSGTADEGDPAGRRVGADHEKVRCNDQQQAFEWSVDIRQGTIFGNDSAGPVAGLITCDGRFHTVDALVPGRSAPTHPGTANV